MILEALLPPPAVRFSLSLVEMDVLRVVLGFRAPRVTEGVRVFSATVPSRLAWPVTAAARVSLPTDFGRRRLWVLVGRKVTLGASLTLTPPGGSDLRFSTELFDFLTGTPDFVTVLFWCAPQAHLVMSIVDLLFTGDFPEGGEG